MSLTVNAIEIPFTVGWNPLAWKRHLEKEYHSDNVSLYDWLRIIVASPEVDEAISPPLGESFPSEYVWVEPLTSYKINSSQVKCSPNVSPH